MHMKVFGIKLEFNKQRVTETISSTIVKKQKGYVCVVDGNVLATAYKKEPYRKIINDAIVNCCDGSSIALLASWLHKSKLNAFTGPELFESFVASGSRQYFLGNTQEVLDHLLKKLTNKGVDVEKMKFKTLPFKNVEDFDYSEIAEDINKFEADIVWVSLGAPKQENFISKLFPLIKKGVLIAIGAAFNLYLDNEKYSRAPLWMRNIHLEWLFRLIQQPKKQSIKFFNYISVLPILIIKELRIKKKRRV